MTDDVDARTFRHRCTNRAPGCVPNAVATSARPSCRRSTPGVVAAGHARRRASPPAIGKHDSTSPAASCVEPRRPPCRAAVTIPVNVDAERCFADTPDGRPPRRSNCSPWRCASAHLPIEDCRPGHAGDRPAAGGAERVAAAAEAAHRHGIVLTVRAENRVYGIDDLDDTLARLTAYREAEPTASTPPASPTLTQIAAS